MSRGICRKSVKETSGQVLPNYDVPIACACLRLFAGIQTQQNSKRCHKRQEAREGEEGMVIPIPDTFDVATGGRGRYKSKVSVDTERGQDLPSLLPPYALGNGTVARKYLSTVLSL